VYKVGGRSCNPFDGDIWDNVQRVNSSRDVVSRNLVGSRLDVRSNSGGIPKLPLAERAFEIPPTMGKGLLMLQKVHDSGWQEAHYKHNLPAKGRWQIQNGESIWNTGDVWVDWKAAKKKSLSHQQRKPDKTV
jgi:hypothetical protein